LVRRILKLERELINFDYNTLEIEVQNKMSRLRDFGIFAQIRKHNDIKKSNQSAEAIEFRFFLLAERKIFLSKK